MSLRSIVTLSLMLFLFGRAQADVNPSMHFGTLKPGLDMPLPESLLRSKVKDSDMMMLSFDTLYCTKWKDARKLIDTESKGKDTETILSRLDSCDIQCLTFWPEKVLMEFRNHTGKKHWAVQALQPDLLSTVYVFFEAPSRVPRNFHISGTATSSVLELPTACQ